jgi:hypothetical protein
MLLELKGRFKRWAFINLENGIGVLVENMPDFCFLSFLNMLIFYEVGTLDCKDTAIRYPYTGLGRPLWLQEVHAPRISRQSERMKVAELSAIHPVRFYPPGDTPHTHFC